MKSPVSCRVCGGKNYSGGFCSVHRREHLKAGGEIVLLRPQSSATKGMSVRDRIAFYCEADPVTDCWNGKGSRKGGGYGRISVNGVGRLAHRVSYEEHVGPIPEGMWVLHRCDNRLCVNPGHLFLGDAADNAHDRNIKDRQASVLSRKQVIAILQDPRSHGPVAADYAVEYQTILAIRRGRKWAHVPRDGLPAQAYARARPGPKSPTPEDR